jgi:hypothetical protein
MLSIIIFIITRGWHNRPGVAAVPIVSQQKKKKKKKPLLEKLRRDKIRLRHSYPYYNKNLKIKIQYRPSTILPVVCTDIKPDHSH